MLVKRPACLPRIRIRLISDSLVAQFAIHCKTSNMRKSGYPMNGFKLHWLLVLGLSVALPILGQTPQAIRGADERFKVDILLVVAHPDDEGGATPYLARAIYDLHKRVAVVYATRGGSGGNDYSREHGPAPGEHSRDGSTGSLRETGNHQRMVSGRQRIRHRKMC